MVWVLKCNLAQLCDHYESLFYDDSLYTLDRLHEVAQIIRVYYDFPLSYFFTRALCFVPMALDGSFVFVMYLRYHGLLPLTRCVVEGMA